MEKLNKNSLKRDRVESETIHVGIELELRARGSDESSHDDDACHSAGYEAQEEYYSGMTSAEILWSYFSVARGASHDLAYFFNRDEWIESQMQDYQHECSGDCGFGGNEGDSIREDIADHLKTLTNNSSIKVVPDGSIETNDDQIDIEVCWNYFVSKDTLNDNTKILNHLKETGCNFDTSCGLHINLNNYLKIEQECDISTDKLDFLFNIVAPSRRMSHFCNRYAISKDQKYSMIYNQGDRLEFRFFSPTLEVEKLNHYVRLAHHVYKRLAGQNVKLPKKTETYLRDKMSKDSRKFDQITIDFTIDSINSIQSIAQMQNLSNCSTNNESEAA